MNAIARLHPACIFLLLAAIVIFHNAIAEDAPKPLKKPVVLFAVGYCDAISTPDPVLFQKMQDAGFEIGYATQEELDEKRISQFNAVVLLGTMKCDNFMLNDKIKKFHAMLAAYSAKGGGVFVNLRGGESPFGVLSAIDLLQPRGCTPLVQSISDPLTRATGTLREFPFAYTTDIAAHAVTKDVHGLWYPIEFGKNIGEPWTHPFRTDNTWTVVAKGGKRSATEYTPTGVANVDQVADKTMLTENVPLLAVKTENDGRSRFAVTGIHSSFTFCTGYGGSIDGVVFEKGLLGNKSDVLTLYVNTLRWLAEPSLQSGELGGAVTTQELRNTVKKIFPRATDIDWKTVAANPERPLARGLFGARSTFSTGTNSVEEMAAAAKAAGLDYIVFAEDFANLKTKNAAEIDAACKKVSGPDFTAVPGFVIQDDNGSYWFYAKSPLVFPAAELLTPDGTKFFMMNDKPVWTTPLKYWLPYQYPGPGLLAASMKHNKAAMQYYDYRDYSAVAIYTYENGKLVDDLSKEYAVLQQNAQSLAPISISIVNSAQELRDAVKPGLPLTFIASDKGPALTDRINKLGSYMDEPHSFVSSGPVLKQWRVTRGGNMYPFNAGFFNASHYRFQAGLHATSDVGIREVTIVEGGKPFRRFQYNGDKDVVLDLPLIHDRQHHLVAYVTDLNGGMAVSGEIWDRSELFEDFYCADRNNHLLVGVLPGADGSHQQFESGCITMKGRFFVMQMGEWFMGFTGQDPNAGFDGSVSGGATFNSTLAMQTTPAWDDALNAQDMMALSSADLCIRDRFVTHKYRDGWKGLFMAWESILPTVPTECFTLVQHQTAYGTSIGARTNFMQCDITITFKRDVALQANVPARLQLGSIEPRASRSVCVRDADGHVTSFNWDESRTSAGTDLHGTLAPGSYISFFGSPLGGAHYFPLGTKLEYDIHQAPNKGVVDLYLPLDKRTFVKGDTLSFSILVASSRATDNKTNLIAEEVGRKYGLFGAPTTHFELQSGTVKEINLCARLDAQDGGVSGILRDNALPGPLPVRVAKLNDRWTAQYYNTRTGEHRPIAVFEGEARTNLVNNGEQEFFIGHPFVCNQADVTLTAVENAGAEWLIDLHNPTDTAKKVTVSRTPAFPMKGMDSFEIDLPAGASLLRTVQLQDPKHPVVVAAAPTDSKTKLIGYWRLSDGTGSVAADSSGENAGKLVDAPQWIDAGGKKALAFDGEKSGVDLPNSPALDTLQDGDYSLSAWFNPSATPAPDSDYMHSGYGIVMKVGNHIGLSYLNNNAFSMGHWLADNTYASAVSAHPYPPGTMHHIVGVVNKTQGETKIYVDGEPAGSATFTPNAPTRDYAGKQWEIGTAYHFGDQRIWPAKGVIHDVRIYSGALRDADVKALYEAEQK